MAIEINLKRRPWLGRLMQLPKVFRSHYGILRNANGRLGSAVNAWRLAKALLDDLDQPKLYIRSMRVLNKISWAVVVIVIVVNLLVPVDQLPIKERLYFDERSDEWVSVYLTFDDTGCTQDSDGEIDCQIIRNVPIETICFIDSGGSFCRKINDE